jgi:hypothetical protein
MTVSATGSTACPNCGAPVRFRWAQAVQTTCDFCKSVLVRQGLDLTRVGTQAEFPQTGSPIQLGVEGQWRGKNFVVVGRVTYAWQSGRWNEWHCRLSDGRSAWLSDAQLEFAMTMQLEKTDGLPDPHTVRVGQKFSWASVTYQVANITPAVYVGTEGELPFTTSDKAEYWFADLQNAEGAMATIDGSETPALLYVGEYVDFDALQLKGVREFEGW